MTSMLKSLFQNGDIVDNQLNSKEEINLLDNIEKFFRTTVQEVMVPRTEVTSIEKNASLKEVAQLINKSGFSRIPVQDKKRDNIVGILYAKDLIKEMEHLKYKTVSELMRKPFFTSYSLSIHELLTKFRKQKVHFAIVIDQYGGTDGIITIEDIIEELIGDIQDEFDQNTQASYEKINDDFYIMDANYLLDDFNQLFNTDFEQEGTETIGGYLCHSIGKIPEKDEAFQIKNINIRILERNKRKLLKLQIEPRKQ